MELNDAKELAIEKMNLHGLTGNGWVFRFDNSVRRFGVCKFSSRVIGLSRELVKVNGYKEVLDVILHEIAHALVGRSHGHDDVWKMKCIEIGAKPERCYSVREGNVKAVSLRYKAICEGCGFTHQRAKRPSVEKYSCKCQSGISWDKKKLLKFIDTKFGE